MNELKSLSEIFNHKIFRIPDYQRGFAWLVKPHLTDFWEDIITLNDGKKHYTGVLSLEPVDKDVYDTWVDDWWLIEKNYKPFFIVDGQQRITTAIILIQAILEVMEEDNKENKPIQLNFASPSEIRREYIFQNKHPESIVRSYIFGYEKDNPSNEFLRTRVFNEPSSSNSGIETLYTLNLENAKKFFKDNLRAFPEPERKKEIERIYKKLTTALLFNEYVIDEEMDVFVAFETMNNRGKKLSNLELLKNRLIYLSTLYRVSDDEKITLRNRINDCWKEVYFELGRNKDRPLNDDDFLKAHRIIYFGYSRAQAYDYSHFLLNEQFTSKKVLEQVKIEIKTAEIVEQKDEEIEDDGDEVIESKQITVSKLPHKDIEKYVSNLQLAARFWYYSYFPKDELYLSSQEQEWLNRLNRIGISYFRPLVLSSFLNPKVSAEERITLFTSIERFIFIAFRLSQARSNYGDSEFYNAGRDLHYGRTTITQIIEQLNRRMDFTFKDGIFNSYNFKNFIDNKFKYYAKDGYYGWGGLRYLLFEYETYLYKNSMTNTPKINWSTFVNTKDTVTIEHIYPQTPSLPCWIDSFQDYSAIERQALTNSLGNLLALSQPKNSSLQNDCYLDKRADKGSLKGYFNGSYSETRVAEMNSSWTPMLIKKRGLELLDFIEKRWNISFGDESQKSELLHVGFVK